MRAAALLLALPMTAVAWSQLAPSPDAPPVSNAPAVPSDQSVATFKVNVNLVDVFFTARDKHGELIPHLTKNDCSVAEDKTPQKLKTFTAETDLPLTLGILLDTSGSQQDVLPLEQQAGAQFLREVLRSKDEAFLASFDVNVDLLEDFTNSPRELADAMDKAQINTAGGNGSGLPGMGGGPVPTIGDPKGTLLYDAIYQSATQKLSEQTGRKALIILTDGQDEGSVHKIGEAISAAERSNVMVYVILIADVGGYLNSGMGYYGFSAAKQLTESTGGRLINVGNNGKKLAAAFQEISDELRSEYLATYTPTNTKLDGSFRRISVSCGEGTKVQTRKGYFAPNAESGE
ncbi:MAG TPA: VWA domain-containing protein [Terracidiphilus sp.]|nr:VWA domain-containing protein [Terracidiphilus sp.]